MEEFNREAHWQKIYTTKQLNEVSWYQQTPTTSLEYFSQLNIPLNASIIDVGGGDSFLVDHLLNLGYTNITILDISLAAIIRAKERLAEKNSLVKWIVSDVVHFKPEEKYDVWHDRAAFHFLTDAEDINQYKKITSNHISKNGYLIVGTFSKEGPTKCSGINIQQYSKENLEQTFSENFNLQSSQFINHSTPFNTIQQFIFCCFQKK